MLRCTVLRRLPFDSAYLINLPHRTDRLTFMWDQFRIAGIPESAVTVYPAVVGKNLDLDKVSNYKFVSALGALRLREPEERRIWGMELNLGALGCALSHVDLWGAIAARRLDRCLVVEDDSIFHSSFLQECEAVMSMVPADWEIVYLSGLDTEQKGHRLQVNSRVRQVPRMHRTTNCYMVNHRGAKSLLKHCLPLTYQLDTQMTINCAPHPRSGELYVTAPVSYSAFPQLVVQATRFGSDIQDVSNVDAAAEEAARIESAKWV